MLCPACGVEQLSNIRFCEDCGARLAGAPSAPVAAAGKSYAAPCPKCGAGQDADDTSGFCPQCGFEQASVVEDHLEIFVSDDLAGVSDRGPKRTRNEDCLALGSDAAAGVLVVCDGVSNSQQPDKAARVAANCACEELLRYSRTDGRIDVSGDGRSAMFRALRAADSAVRALPGVASHPGEPPETTIVAALWQRSKIVIGWVGDSRAYWLDERGMRQLTEDHSWLNEVVRSGEMGLEQAMRHPQAHAITRTLGGPGNGAGADEPSVVELEVGRELSRPGRLILCTDGFWGLGDPEQFSSLVTRWIGEHPPGADSLSLVRRLVENACVQSGHDNITVAMLSIVERATA